MLIAQQKRRENIAEYLLYMWQVEDLLRACQFDDARIDQLLVARFVAMDGVTEAQLADVRRWYRELRDMMLTEGRRDGGHLQINQNILIDLTDLHQRLLRHGQDAIYTSAYYATLPYIVELRAKADPPQGELETCFSALYGLMTLRLEGRDVTDATRGAMQQIAKFIAQLAEKYRLWKAGQLKLDEDR